MLDAKLKQALSGEMTPKFLATLDDAGKPNCVPVISLAPWDDTTLIFGEFLMNKTRANLLVNDKVGVTVINDALETWSLKGTFLGFETTGPHVEWINHQPMFRYNAYTSIRAAGVIRVESVSSMSAYSSKGLLFDFAQLWLAAPFLKRSGRACMPLRVREKFGRTKAVRALAFRDEDGFPCTMTVMACIPSGANRLLLRSKAICACRDISPETEVAISIITMDPVAYQVKGTYQGCVAGCGVVQVNECYSASPPLLGERLDTLNKP